MTAKAPLRKLPQDPQDNDALQPAQVSRPASMPNFLENIFAQLKRAESRVVLREIHGDRFVSVTGKEFLERANDAFCWRPIPSSGLRYIWV